ncbi:type II toxin-antitoxin system VapC family toxin [Adhaeretor mobilis]|uniref:PIN domain-containing protein n=1 Tax=Adhaeretor mobilis TaxID=1930276 RepID=A0A517N0J0_9BACT|nr:type II toxin-antitoxin system VapC family toxin [Adhaeretor mobilis]QDT00643.1 hypothetical protein HG15A2_39820 [Adhaeretor mobilis]
MGCIAGRIHPDPAIAYKQEITRQWWSTAKARYELWISDVVLGESSDGDPSAAQERLEIIQGLAQLDASETVKEVTKSLLANKAVPESQPRDAFHIAVAAVNNMQFITTWNFKHILNPTVRHLIESVCKDAGFDLPVICTPEQLLKAYNVIKRNKR